LKDQKPPLRKTLNISCRALSIAGSSSVRRSATFSFRVKSHSRSKSSSEPTLDFSGQNSMLRPDFERRIENGGGCFAGFLARL